MIPRYHVTCEQCDWEWSADDLWEADNEAEGHMDTHPGHLALVSRETDEDAHERDS